MNNKKTTFELQKRVAETFYTAFGRTPLRQRQDDIFGEAIELNRATDIKNLKEEAGDLLASTLALCHECEWSAEELVQATLDKIKRRENQYKALGRKKTVAILGGALNPVTIGHIKLAQFVLNTSNIFDEVWLCPCAHHMYNKEMESSEDRLAMCKLAAQCDGRIKVFNYEIEHDLKGETYHFVKRLLEERFAKDEYDFSIIIGMDNANTFHKWVNYKLLRDMIRFVVVSRKGTVRNEKVNWYLKPPHIYLAAEEEIPNTSSTEVREAIAGEMFEDDVKKIVAGLVDDKVAQYIEEHKLYLQPTGNKICKTNKVDEE